MMKEIVLKAKKREILTKGETNKLRGDGKVPGIYYFHKEKPIPLYVDKKDLIKVIHKKTHMITLKLDNKTHKALIRELQHHPITDEIIHVDFMGVTAKEIIEVEVPIHVVGTSIGVKEFGGILEQHLWSLKIKCEADMIPDAIEIDVTQLNLGDAIYVRDLKLENLQILTPQDVAIVSIVKPTGAAEAEVGVVEEEVTEESAEEEKEPDKEEQ